MDKTGTAKEPASVRAQAGLILGLLAGAAVPVMVIPAAAQQASQDMRNVTVLQRPRERFDAIGIPIGQGGLRLLPSLEVSESYTDNLRATHSNPISDFETVISPELKLESNWSRHRLAIRAFADIHRFIDTQSEDHENYGAEGTLRLDLAHDGNLNMSGGYTHQSVSRGDPEERGRITPEEVNNTAGQIDWSQRITRLLVGARAEYLGVSEVSALDRDKDYKTYTGAVRLGYVVSSAVNVFAEPFYTIRDFDLAVDFNGVNRDSKLMGINAGVSYDITELLFGSTRIGWYRADFEDSRFAADTGISIQSNTTWNVTARDSLIFTIQRNNVVSNEPNVSSRVQTGGEVEYQHEFRRDIVMRANVSYYNDDYVNSIQKEDRFSGGIRGDYFLTRNLSFYASYKYTTLTSSLPNSGYDENRIIFGIRGQI